MVLCNPVCMQGCLSESFISWRILLGEGMVPKDGRRFPDQFHLPWGSSWPALGKNQPKRLPTHQGTLLKENRMFRYNYDTVGTDKGRNKFSDSLTHHVGKAVAGTMSSAHFKIRQSSLAPHWRIHKLIFHTPRGTKQERGDSLNSVAELYVISKS